MNFLSLGTPAEYTIRFFGVTRQLVFGTLISNSMSKTAQGSYTCTLQSPAPYCALQAGMSKDCTAAVHLKRKRYDDCLNR